MIDKPVLKSPVPRPTETTLTPSPTTVAPTSAATPPATPPATTNPRHLDRDRAAKAWESIKQIKLQSYQAKYGSLARKMPTLIQINGLAQTLAFLKAKAKEDDPKSRKEYFVQAFYHLSDWVCSHVSGSGNLLDRVLAMDSQSYRLATSEALAFLQWLKRFAEAELGSEEDN